MNKYLGAYLSRDRTESVLRLNLEGCLVFVPSVQFILMDIFDLFVDYCQHYEEEDKINTLNDKLLKLKD